MKVRILYCIDEDGPGLGGPFPEVVGVFHEDTNDQDILKRFLDENEKRDHPTGEFLDDLEDEDQLFQQLIGGFDVQGEGIYWNLVTKDVE